MPKPIAIAALLFCSAAVAGWTSAGAGWSAAVPAAPDANDRRAPQPTPIRLGAIYDLSGRQSGLDRPSADGALLAARQLAARGGLLGRPLELTIADGRSEPQEVAAQTARLIDAGAVALLGLSDTDMAAAAGEVAAERRRVFLTSGATSPQLPLQIREWLFLACFTDNAQAAAAAEFGRRTLAAERVWVVSDRDMSYTELLRRYFVDAWSARGGIVAHETPFHSLKSAVVEIPGAGQSAQPPLPGAPDVLFLAAGPAEAPAMVRDLRARGAAVPIVGGDSFDTAALLAAARGPAPVYFTTHAFLDSTHGDERARAFVRDFEAEYGRPPDAFAALGYDAVMLLADAIARAGADEPEAIRTALAATRDWHGVTGAITYAAGERVPRKPVYVLRAEQGRRALAAAIVPQAVPAHELR